MGILSMVTVTHLPGEEVPLGLVVNWICREFDRSFSQVVGSSSGGFPVPDRNVEDPTPKFGEAEWSKDETLVPLGVTRLGQGSGSTFPFLTTKHRNRIGSF